jgi:hypothetical protein
VIKRVKNSFAFRSPVLYKPIVKWLMQSAPKTKTEVSNEYNLVVLVGKKQVDMLYVCLRSVYRHFKQVPHIFVFMDAGVAEKQCNKLAKRLPGDNISFISRAACLAYHDKNAPLLTFAGANPMGLKLAAILQVLDAGKPVLYCDTDVLWYGDPFKTIAPLLAKPDFELALSEDFQPAYDFNLVNKGDLQALKNSPHFCAGILLIKKLSPESLQRMNKLVAIAAKESDHFSEQTIFAWLNKKSSDQPLDSEAFTIKTSDQFEIRAQPMPGVIARHYIGSVRHLFWRDAVWLN